MSKKASGSGTDTIIKLVLIFFISLLSFSVGTFVGKQVSDSDYKRIALEGGDYNQFHGHNDGEEQHAEEAISEEEIASLTKEFVDNEARDIASVKEEEKHHGKDHKAHGSHDEKHDDHAHKKDEHHAKPAPDGYKKFDKNKEAHHPAPEKMHKPKKEAHHPAPEKKHEAKKPEPVQKAAARVANDKAPIKDPKKTRKPTSILPSVATSAIGKYTVQVASYADEGEAKQHSARLKSEGWNAFYIPADVKGRTWFRVSVGLFATTVAADKYKKELLKDGKVSSAFVSKIIK